MQSGTTTTTKQELANVQAHYGQRVKYLERLNNELNVEIKKQRSTIKRLESEIKKLKK